VWYERSPHVTGDWRFTTCSGFSNFNSRLALYDACLGNHLGCGSGPLQYACYDPWDSELTVAVTAGNSYYLQVSGEAGAVGTLRMDIENVGPGYCPLTPNSAGPGAVMSASGNYIPNNSLTLVCTGAPPVQPALFFYGPAQLQLPFGEGNRCVGGEVVRLWPPGFTDATGMITRAVDNTLPSNVGVIVNGARLNFQCWFRDPAGGASGFNLSNAYRVDFFGG
ncbi:MAG: hypothetical protein ABGY41_21695, partial [Candidatus Poribacteria bacterium]